MINAAIGNTGYRQFPVHSIESYMVDTAMDTDSDPFSIDIGMPTPEYAFLLRRDNEARVSIFTGEFPRANVEYLQTGIADMIDFDSDDHVLSINGRDLSSLATDSDAEPTDMRLVRPHKWVAKRARALGISDLQLADVKHLWRYYTDGSESEWETWYRMYRKRQMYLWLTPQGRLIADKPNYSESSDYLLGKHPPGAASPGKWIPVEGVRVLKNNQNRVGRVWVFGERNEAGFVAKARDTSIDNWKKQPLRIVTSNDAKNQADARKEAFEEIYEGKVGALELLVRIRDEGNLIRQNRMARLRYPDSGIDGLFFVVGVQYLGGPDGYFMNVRLRENRFALSRRVPDDPEIEKDPTENAIGVGGAFSDLGVRWGDAFASAAREFHDGWDLKLFTGVLLAICDKETGFRNVRYSGTIEWYPSPSSQVGQGAHRRLFANARLNPLNPLSPNSEAAVGPMQLVTPEYKVWADGYGGRHDEYEGGRWKPAANIRAAARAFLSKLAGAGDSHNDANIWIGVRGYYGSRSDAENDAYVADVKRRYNNKFKETVESAFEASVVLPAGAATNITVKDDKGSPFTVSIPEQAPRNVKQAINYALRQLGKPYQWGAEGPNKFDCSGLVMAMYRFAGVTGPGISSGRGTTYTFWRDYSSVKKDLILPGDLVFFRPDLGHMGIYVGKGHMIHAPKTGDVVKISSINTDYYRNGYRGARRVVNWDGRGVTGPD